MLRRLTYVAIPLLVIGLLVGRAVLRSRTPAVLGSFGTGPDVVLVHGLGSSAEHWLPMARDLARDHHVVLTELPGHGLADMPSPLTLEAAAHELDRAIAEACSGPVVLVGHSVGGLVAAAEALDHPQRIQSLVLVETALEPQMSAEERKGLLDALDRDYRGTLREAYVPFGRDSAQGLALFAEAAELDSTMLKQWIRLAVTEDLSVRIGGLGVPLLVVMSERSWPDSESWQDCGRILGYAHAPAITPVRVPGTGHFVMLDQPHLLAGMIRRFARERSLSAAR